MALTFSLEIGRALDLGMWIRAFCAAFSGFQSKVDSRRQGCQFLGAEFLIFEATRGTGNCRFRVQNATCTRQGKTPAAIARIADAEPSLVSLLEAVQGIRKIMPISYLCWHDWFFSPCHRLCSWSLVRHIQQCLELE